MTKLVTVVTFPDRIEAELARTALEATGVYAIVAADDAGNQNPGLGFSRRVSVLVRQEDVELARQVLQDAAGRAMPEEH